MNVGIKLQMARIQNIFNNSPLFMARYKAKEVYKEINDILGKYNIDIVHMEGFSIAQYLHVFKDIPIIFSTIDPISLNLERAIKTSRSMFRKIYMYYEYRKTKKLEKHFLAIPEYVHVHSKADKEYLIEMLNQDNIINIELGIESNANSKVRNIMCEDVDILITGAFYVDSVAEGVRLFIKKILPKISDRIGSISVLLVGKGLPKDLLRLVDINKGLSYSEWVPNFYETVRRSKLVYIPDTAGTGIKNRVIESMINRKVVIGWPVVFMGMNVENGKDCIIWLDDNQVAAEVIDLLNNDHRRDSMGYNAMNIIVNMYSIEKIIEKWKSVYESAIESRKQGES